jgi:hypothetical protein
MASTLSGDNMNNNLDKAFIEGEGENSFDENPENDRDSKNNTSFFGNHNIIFGADKQGPRYSVIERVFGNQEEYNNMS